MSLAWVLDFGGGHRAAVGEQHQVHLMHAPEVIELALTPPHARHALLWNDRCVPVLDLGMWLSQGSGITGRRYLGIYLYPGLQAGSVQFGALWTAKPPRRFEVDDRMAAELPARPSGWSRIACSCFDSGDGAVPILDLALVFADALTRAPSAAQLQPARESLLTT